MVLGFVGSAVSVQAADWLVARDLTDGRIPPAPRTVSRVINSG